ncbi:hypothetical protein D3C71_1839200 [compost metagenome]
MRFRIGDTLCQNDTTLRIGIQNLHGMTAQQSDDIAWAVRRAGCHVLRCRNDHNKVHFRLQLADDVQGT